MDATTAPDLASFVPVPAGSDFPIQNLPWGVFTPRSGGGARCGVRIGDHALDLAMLQDAGLLDVAELPAGVFAQDALNAFMALPAGVRRATRARISELLDLRTPALRSDTGLCERALWPCADIAMHLPARIGDYTDFYSSREHATNVGIMFRGKDNALMPNWLHLPVGYHGRASSIVVDGTPVRRPLGQTVAADATAPTFGPCRLLDFELELGFFTAGPGNAMGEPIPADAADDAIFGMVLVNDWSARDIQKWEYQPLGPFTAKNFATSISPWIVPWEALQPFRCPPPAQDPQPLPYLRSPANTGFDIALTVALQAPDVAPQTICRSNARYLYWTVQQQLAHHTITGCNVRPGDLMASGTISGPDKGSFGSLLELTWRGAEPLRLADGNERRFLQDGDRVIMAGHCEGRGVRIGFGQVAGTVLPVRD